MAIVIVGGGIVGVTAAYYLTKQGHKVKIIEKCGIACHSSGKAGGFLTDGDSGWHQGPICGLAKHSFALHEELAKEFGASNVGFRRVKCLGRGNGAPGSAPAWLKERQYERNMGDESGLAQVTPYKLMDALIGAAKGKGCEVVIGKVVGVEMSEQTVTAVNVEQDGKRSSVECSAVIFAMGAWARDAVQWFPESSLPQQTVSSRYTSVIWDNVEIGKAATMVFVMGEHDVEIYPRENECYANGCPDRVELPDNPLDIVPPPQTVEDVIQETTAAVASLKDAKVARSTACFLAGSDDGAPVIGRVPEVKNAVIGCGGGCWGILNGPAMGQAVAALAVGEAPPCDVAPFDPARFARTRAGSAAMLSKLQAMAAANPELAMLLEQDNEGVMQLLQALRAAEG